MRSTTSAFIIGAITAIVANVEAQQAARQTKAILDSPLDVTRFDEGTDSVELSLDAAKYAAVKRSHRLNLRSFAASPDAVFDLDLEKIEVFSPDARIVLGTAGGDVPLPRPNVAIFRGTVSRQPDSIAYISFSPHGSNGFVVTGQTIYMISSQRRNGVSRTVAFDTASLPPGAINPTPWNCEAENTPIPPDRRDWFARGVHELGGVSTAAGISRRATLAIDTDWEFTADQSGDTDASGAYAATLIGAVSEIYIAQVNTQIEIGYLRLWSDSSDPWTSTNTSNQLGQFRSHWESLMDGVERHAAHMLSGRNLGGGIAYLGGLCSDGFGYAVSANLNGGFPYPLQNNSSQNWDIMVTAHELGHNFGAPHTHSVNPQIDGCGTGNCSVTPNGTIMSYCHQCPGGLANILLEFHERMKDEYIQPFLDFQVGCNLSTEPVDCASVDPPTTHTLGTMNRFLAVESGNPGQRTAVRITYDSVPPPNDHLTGTVAWLSVPLLYSEHSGSRLGSDAPTWPTYYSSGVTCTPSYVDWSLFGTIYLRGPSLVPGSSFTIESLILGCDPELSSSYSTPLNLTTSIYGDVVGDCTVTPCTPPNTVVEGSDITAILDKFKNLPGAPIKARCDLDPADPDGLITSSDIIRVLDAFQADPFLYSTPSPCP